MWLK
jgi:hypothetical protein